MNDTTPKRYTFGREHRLSSSRAFSAVYDAKGKKPVGPLVICTKPNELGHPRLGLSVSRRVGTAVKRNRIKRLLREAFRLSQYDWPVGYDIIVVVRPHETHSLAEYQRLLFSGMRQLHQLWQKRAGVIPAPPDDTVPSEGASRSDNTAIPADKPADEPGDAT